MIILKYIQLTFNFSSNHLQSYIMTTIYHKITIYNIASNLKGLFMVNNNNLNLKQCCKFLPYGILLPLYCSEDELWKTRNIS